MPDERKRIVNLQEASTLSAAMCFVEDSTDGTGTRKVTFENLQNTINQTGAANNLAPAYDATNTYNVGEMCTYQGRLYVCTTQISTAEAWTAGHWTAVKVGEKISDLNGQLKYNDDKTQSALLEANGLSNLMTFDGAIHSSGNNFSSITSANHCAVIEVKPNDTIKFKTYSALLCEFASAYQTPKEAPQYGSITGVLASGQSNLRIVCSNQTEYTFTVPATAKYFILQVLDSNVSRIPTTFAINGIDYVLPIRDAIKSNVQALEKTVNAVKSQTEVKEKLFGTSSVNASVVTTTGKLYNVLTKADVDYSSGEYSSLSGLTSGDILSVTGFAWSSNDRYPLYAFYDNSNNLLDTFGEPDTAYTDYLVKVPSGATRIIVAGSSVYHTAIKSFTPLDLKTYIDGGINSIWKDKKIGVLGTSVAFGANASTSYGYEASERLGFELRMFGVPGLAIETESDGTPKQYGSFTCTKAEYTADGWTIPDNPVTPYVPGGTYNNYYKTYENVFVEDNADIDLWVYAVAPNNVEFGLSDWDAFNKTEWRYNDNSAFSEHRKTFIGALLFIMDQMYTLNPNARMVFVMDSLFSYSTGLEALNTIAEQWNMPIIDLWGKINICPPSLTKLKSLNGTDSHPSTFAQEIMGKMFAGELELIS